MREPSWRKCFELLDRHVGVAGQVQQRVEQHRPVPGRQHEPVAVRPVGRRGVELQVLLEQHRRHVRHAHRHARDAPSSPSAPRPSPAPAARPPSSSGRGGRWRSSGMFTGTGLSCCGPLPELQANRGGELIPARPGGQGGSRLRRWRRERSTATREPSGTSERMRAAMCKDLKALRNDVARAVASLASNCIVPEPCLKRATTIESAEMSQISELEAQLAEAFDRLRAALAARAAAARPQPGERALQGAHRRARGREGRARRRARAAARQARQGRGGARRPDRPAQAADRGGLTCPSSSSRSAAACSRSPASPARSPRSSGPAACSTPRPSASATPAARPRSGCCCSPA